MSEITLYPVGVSASCRIAAAYLAAAGISTIDHPAPEVTHVLTDVPLQLGNDLRHILTMVPPQVKVLGGNLDIPHHVTYDLLKDEDYLTQNALITAHCAIQTALALLSTTLPDTPTLILGWGRIGKHLSRLLTTLGCPVTVAARKASDRATVRSLGMNTQDTAQISLDGQTLLFNTVPHLLLTEEALKPYPKLIKIDLASCPGLAGPDIITARGLPGKLAPESSGRLIAETAFRYIKEETL